MLVPKNKPQGYKENSISFIGVAFEEFITIVDWLSNMKLYVFGID